MDGNNNNNEKTFFTDEIIESYVDYQLNGGNPIRESLGGYELLNYSQFMNWWNDYLHYPNGVNEDIKDSINESFNKIFTSKCQDLNTGYIDGAIDSLKNNPNFDVLFAVYNKSNIILDKQNPSENEINEYQSRKSDSVGGFIIVQKGECKNLPQTQTAVTNDDFKNVYSVFLICTSIISNSTMDRIFGKKTPPPIKGQLLMGAYLFSIKSNESLPQIGVLELLSGYTNIPGFISYSKLGFEKDLNLYGKGCFTSLTNLPMSNYWITKEPDEIIQAVTTVKGLEIDKEPIEIIQFYKSNKDVKKKERLGVFCNILYRIELEPIEILERLIEIYDNDENMENMENFFGYEETNELISVFYVKDTVEFNDNFVTKEDYEKCISDSDDYRNCNIQKSNYPKIIKRIQKYYKKIIRNLLFSNDIFSRYKRKLNVDDDEDDDDIDCDEDSNNKKCKIAGGGKRQKTNKKHRQYKKKTTRILKNKPKYKSKKLVKNRKHSKNQKNKNY